MATSDHSIPRPRPWALPAVTLAIAVAFAALAAADSARDWLWIALGGVLGAAALGSFFINRGTQPAGNTRPRVTLSDLWGLSPDQLAAVAVPALERAGMDLRPTTWRDPGPAQYLAWNRGAEGGFVLVVFLQAPEVTADDLEALARQMQAHGTASGLVVTAGVFDRGARVWAQQHRIRLKDGAALLALLTGEVTTL